MNQKVKAGGAVVHAYIYAFNECTMYLIYMQLRTQFANCWYINHALEKKCEMIPVRAARVTEIIFIRWSANLRPKCCKTKNQKC